TFRQIYLDPGKHGASLQRDTAQLLARLKSAGAEADISASGDPFLLDNEFSAVPADAVTKQFGDAFVARLRELATGQWQGPLESGYGQHLIFVSERVAGRMPALAEVRDAVRREWENARRLEANEKFYQQLLAHYRVEIEPSQLPAPPAKLVSAK